MYLFTASQLVRGLDITATTKVAYIEPTILDFRPKKKPCLRPACIFPAMHSDFVGVATNCRTKYVLLDLAISLRSCDLGTMIHEIS